MTVPQSTYRQFVAIVKEVTMGTTPATTPTWFFPVTNVNPKDIPERIRDEAYDNNISLVRGVYDGVIDCTLMFEGPAYADVIGQFPVALGYTDTITGTGPYSHALKIAAGANQPASYSIFHFNGYETRAYAGMMLDDWTYRQGAKGMATYTSAWKGWKSANVSNPTAVFSTVKPFVGYQGALTVGGVATDRLLSFEMNIKRNVDGIHTINGLQTPSTTFAGGLDASVKSSFLYADDTELNHLLNNDQSAIVLTVTQPASGPVLTVTATKPAWMDGDGPKASGAYLTADFNTDLIYNATDGGPCAITVSNQVAAAYV